MKLSKLSKEDLENMSYDDIAYEILKEKGKNFKIIDLFNQIGKLLDFSEDKIEREIEDFFEMLTLDKRFIMLENGSWDLREKHSEKIIIEDEEEDDIEINIEDNDEPDDDTIFYDEDESDDADEDLKDLVIIDEEEE